MCIAFIALVLLKVVLSKLSLTQGYYLGLLLQSSELQVVIPAS